MTAFERAAESSGALAMSVEGSESLLPKYVEGLKRARMKLALVVSDVVEGVRCVSHNALAMLGLLAVAVVVFLMGRADMRHALEDQTLGWLMARASVRSQAVAEAAQHADNAVLLALAEPEAIQRATAANPAELNRQQGYVAYWIARRYSVAPEPISRLVQEAWKLGQQANMEPTLVLAVMAIESGFNPFAQSHVGAQGLMQVMTRVHHDKYAIFGGQNAAFDPVTNLRVGVQVLKDCIRRAGSLQGGLKYYVGAANMLDDGGYAAKVLAEQAYLKQVAAGMKIPATITLPQTMVQADVVPRVPATKASASIVVPGVALPADAASDAVPSQQPASPRRVEQVALLSNAG
jgi:hypothetical protein